MNNSFTRDDILLLLAMRKILERFEDGPERLKLALESAVAAHEDDGGPMDQWDLPQLEPSNRLPC